MKEKQVSILSTLKISFTHLTFIKEDKTYMYSFPPFSLTCLIGRHTTVIPQILCSYLDAVFNHGMA